MNQDKKEITKGKVLELDNLIQYQKDSVVSRMLIQKQTGNMTLFAFDKDQGLSEHTAPFDALVYILDGEAQVNISQEVFVLKKGEAIIMPANKPHSLKAVEKFKMVLVMIRS
ncbi:MAG: cupin domain-containing protein [Candidatus Omnitrophica bacterium]|jgi:quercetin dioxygenase-like cupin family protein|nr:cupin domain-containing protein [Candidatus Omnitrophota bacterium]